MNNLYLKSEGWTLGRIYQEVAGSICEVAEVEGGWIVFESVSDYEAWMNQV